MSAGNFGFNEPEYVDDASQLKQLDQSFSSSGIEADDATDYSHEGKPRSMVDTV